MGHTTTASTVTLSSYASVVTTMPSGYSALGFSAQAGFTLAIDGCGALIKAELTTPPLTTSAAALITGSVSAGCLQYDVDARAYNKTDLVTDNGQSRTICVTGDTTPEVGDGRYMIAVFCNASPA